MTHQIFMRVGYSNRQIRLSEEQIDKSMSDARNFLEVLESQLEPYAMHKAVESLPTKLLIEIINRKGSSK